MSASAATLPTATRHAGKDEDAELVARIGRGDLSGLGELFDRYGGGVRRLHFRLGAPASDVDDLTQQTFLEVLAVAARFRTEAAVRPWLFGLAAVVARRHRRSASRLLARLNRWARDRSEESGESPEQLFELNTEARRAQEALLKIAPRKREVFVLSVFGELSGAEIATQLDIPVATVWTRLHHAREELKALLGGRDEQ